MIHALHGNLGSPRDWDALALPDLRAVDLWAWQERFPGITLEAFGECFAEEVAASDPEPVLLGYSLGGRLALRAMAARPDLWKAVVLVSTHPGLTGEAEKNERLERDREWAGRARDLPWEEFLDLWNAQEVLAGQPIPTGQRELENRREAVARAFESWSLGSREAMTKVLEGVPFPVLIVTGKDDEKFSKLAKRFAGVGERIEWKQVPGCGHRVPMEAPERLREMIGEWLAR